MKFRPLHDRVLVRRLEEEEKTASGIIIPDAAKEKPMEGEIIAVGAGARDEHGALQALDVKAGGLFLFLDAPNEHAVVQGSKLHSEFSSGIRICWCVMLVALPVRECQGCIWET